MTQTHAADSLEWSLSKLIRIESGAQAVSVTDLRAMLDLYQVTDQQITDDLIAAARGSRRKPWWHGYREIVSPQFAEYLGHEGSAATVQAFHPYLVPTLLQTEEYATALLSAFPDIDRGQRIVELRMERQRRLFAATGQRAGFIVNEEALYRWIGGPAVLQHQLEMLLDAIELQNTSVHIVPFTAGAHAGLGGPFVILRGDEPGTELVYLESISGDQFIGGDAATVKEYATYFEQLRWSSLAPAQASQLLREQVTRLRHASQARPQSAS